MITYTDTTLMPFGKHKGKAMANVPAQYLLWLWQQGMREGPVKTYIQSNLDVLQQEVKKYEARKTSRK